jgi:hypothetical protein
MNVDSIIKFLVALGVDSDKIVVPPGRGWVNCPCPLGPYTHGAGEDRHPSFGVAIDETGPSVYYCFGCTQDAQHLGRLLHNIWVLSGGYPQEAASLFGREEIHVRVEERKSVPDVWQGREPGEVKPVPPQVLVQYPLLQGATGYEARRCREWLEDERGIPQWVQNMCRLRYEPHNQWVVFPLTDTRGDVYLLRARARKKKWIRTISPDVAGFPDLTFASLKRDIGVWFGMALVDWDRPVWIVEGELDSMRLMALGCLNTIASATSQVTDLQLDALGGMSIVMGYDDDVAGRHAHSRIVDRLLEKAVVREARWSDADCCDAGDLRDKNQLLQVVEKVRVWDPLT